MDDGTCVRQRAHEKPGAARVIEMHVREQDVVDRFRREAARADGRKQIGHRGIRPGIDERAAPLMDDQMARVEPWAHVERVDGRDAIGKVGEELCDGHRC
jgi:hypothetical protein